MQQNILQNTYFLKGGVDKIYNYLPVIGILQYVCMDPYYSMNAIPSRIICYSVICLSKKVFNSHFYDVNVIKLILLFSYNRE